MIRAFAGKACTLAAVGLVIGAPAALADEQTATVTGVLFDDQNRNGVQDAGEPGLAGLPVKGNETVTTDKDGRYTLTDVPLDSTLDLFLPTAAEDGAVTLSKPADATTVAWISGWVSVEVGADPQVSHDFGYGRWGADQAVGLNPTDGTDTTKLRVGDKVRLTATTTTGDAPGYGGVLVTVPDGMHVVKQQLSPGTAYDWIDARHVRIYGLRNQDPGYAREYLVDVVADKPVEGHLTAVLTHDQNTDTNPDNNNAELPVTVKAKQARQVVMPMHHSAGVTAPPLANTGVEPRPYLVAGVALLGVGVALVGASRRRPRLTESSSS